MTYLQPGVPLTRVSERDLPNSKYKTLYDYESRIHRAYVLLVHRTQRKEAPHEHVSRQETWQFSRRFHPPTGEEGR